MAAFNREYSEEIVNHIREFLESEATQGIPREFVIKLDGEQVFPKTSNLAMFDSFKSFIGPNTRLITFIIYKGSSQRNDKYVLSYSDPNRGAQPLNGVDKEVEFADRLARHENEQELSVLRSNNGKLRQKLRKKKKRIAKLEDTILEMQTARYKLGKLNLGELSSIALEGVLRRNPHWFKAVPGAAALAGVIEADNERIASGAPAAEEEHASFSREGDASEPAEQVEGLSEEQQFDLDTGTAIRQAFTTPQEHTKAIGILKLLSHRKDLMDDVLDMLQSEIPS